MRTVLRNVRRFLAAEGGPTAVEYAFLLGFIITVCIAAIKAVGTGIIGPYEGASETLGGELPDGG